MKQKFRKQILAVGLTATMLTGCTATQKAAKAEGVDPATDGRTPITFVLDWTPNTNHTGLYVADKLGYFTEEGLDVTIMQPPEDGADVLVASGGAQFGVGFQDTMVPALTRDEPMPITAVATILQHNTSGIIMKKGSGSTPKALEGKRYATWGMDVEQAVLKSVVETDGGDFSKVEMVPSKVLDEATALQTDMVDAIWIYYGWAGIQCELAGLDTEYFAFRDIDPVFDYYTPLIIANNAYLEEHPEQALAFMRALSKGYTYAAENPEEASEMLVECAPEIPRDLAKQSQIYLSEQYVAESSRWGEMDSARWNAYYTWLFEQNLIARNIASDLGFTNNFLPVA